MIEPNLSKEYEATLQRATAATDTARILRKRRRGNRHTIYISRSTNT